MRLRISRFNLIPFDVFTKLILLHQSSRISLQEKPDVLPSRLLLDQSLLMWNLSFAELYRSREVNSRKRLKEAARLSLPINTLRYLL